jgi:tol-pal system protein YbgF
LWLRSIDFDLTGDLMKTLCARPILRPALGMALALAFGFAGLVSSAQAQTDDATTKRFDRIERQLREVRDIVLQARSTGQPVEIKMAGPDPEMATLRTRIDDLELTLRQTTGQIDSLSQELAKARRDLKALESDNNALQDRMAAAEGQLASAAQAASQVAPQAAKTAPEVAAPAKAPAPVALPKPQAAVKSPTAASSAGERTAAFQRAKQLLLDGQFPAASTAFQDYVDQYGDTAPNGPEARYWLGETLFIRGSYADAAAAYIGAIRGWPPTVWGAEAVVKLSMSLIELKKTPDACRTLDEFGRRYPAAAPATKARADKARLRAKCA